MFLYKAAGSPGRYFYKETIPIAAYCGHFFVHTPVPCKTISQQPVIVP